MARERVLSYSSSVLLLPPLLLLPPPPLSPLPPLSPFPLRTPCTHTAVFSKNPYNSKMLIFFKKSLYFENAYFFQKIPIFRKWKIDHRDFRTVECFRAVFDYIPWPKNYVLARFEVSWHLPKTLRNLKTIGIPGLQPFWVKERYFFYVIFYVIFRLTKNTTRISTPLWKENRPSAGDNWNFSN